MRSARPPISCCCSAQTATRHAIPSWRAPIRRSSALALSRASSLPGRSLDDERTLMRILKLLVLMAVFAVLPRAAQAQGGFLDFMENLSGPGPSHGFTTTWRGFCVDENNKVIPCLDDSRSGIKGVMRFETSLPYLTTGDNQRFADTPLD